MQKQKLSVILQIVFVIIFILIGVLNYNTALYKNTNITRVENQSVDRYVNGTTLEARFTPSINDVGKYIYFKTKDSTVSISLDNMSLYNFGMESKYTDSPGTTWNTLQITDAMIDNAIVINIHTIPISRFDPNISIYKSNGYTMLFDIVSNEIISIILIALLIATSIATLATSFVNYMNKRPTHAKSMILISMMSIAVWCWSASELYLMQMLIQNAIARYYMYYIAFQLIPTTLIFYIIHKEEDKRYTVIILYSIFLVIIDMLHLFKIWQLHDSLRLFLLVGVASILAAVYQYLRKESGTPNKWVAIGVVGFTVTIVSNIVVFLLHTAGVMSINLAEIGFVWFIGCIAVSNVQEQYLREQRIKRDRLVAGLARTDFLTGLKNRLALNQDLENLDFHAIAVLSIDLNNLKYYNDTYGHKAGDELLLATKNVLLKVLGEGNVYRIGGDEFVGICEKGDSIQYLRNRINEECLIEETSLHGYILEIAIGGCFTGKPGDDFDYLLHEADKDMYVAKAEMKSNSRLDKGNYIDNRMI